MKTFSQVRSNLLGLSVRLFLFSFVLGNGGNWCFFVSFFVGIEITLNYSRPRHFLLLKSPSTSSRDPDVLLCRFVLPSIPSFRLLRYWRRDKPERVGKRLEGSGRNRDLSTQDTLYWEYKEPKTETNLNLLLFLVSLRPPVPPHSGLSLVGRLHCFF